MIFVTVGTHEQQFNRLLRQLDELKQNGDIEEDIIAQTGYSNYKAKTIKEIDFIPFFEMQSYFEKAHIVITHGGPSSFLEAIKYGKTPIVVPRQKKFDEHVNDHQVKFCKQVEARFGNIIVVQDVENLKKTIRHFDNLSANMVDKKVTNNKMFNSEFTEIINRLMQES